MTADYNKTVGCKQPWQTDNDRNHVLPTASPINTVFSFHGDSQKGFLQHFSPIHKGNYQYLPVLIYRTSDTVCIRTIRLWYIFTYCRYHCYVRVRNQRIGHNYPTASFLLTGRMRRQFTAQIFLQQSSSSHYRRYCNCADIITVSRLPLLCIL